MPVRQEINLGKYFQSNATTNQGNVTDYQSPTFTSSLTPYIKLPAYALKRLKYFDVRRHDFMNINQVEINKENADADSQFHHFLSSRLVIKANKKN